MAAWWGGWVLMTYLQWRSLDGLACPSKNSCEILRNNRRVVVVVEGEQEGWICSRWGFAFEWHGLSGANDPPPRPPVPQSPTTTIDTTPKRKREGERRCYRVLAARASTCSWIPNVAEDQRSELSLFCQVCPDKIMWCITPPDTQTNTLIHTSERTHTYTQELQVNLFFRSTEGPSCLTC